MEKGEGGEKGSSSISDPLAIPPLPKLSHSSTSHMTLLLRAGFPQLTPPT